MSPFKHTIYDEDIEIKQFTNHGRMVTAIYHHLNSKHIVIAWNSDFDEQALKNTSKELGLNLDWNTIQWMDIQKSFAVNLGFTTSFISLKKAFELLYLYKRDKWKLLPEMFQSYFSINKETMMPKRNKDSLSYKYLEYRKNNKGDEVYGLYKNKKYKSLIFYNTSDVLDMVALDSVAGIDGFIAQFDNLGLTHVNNVFVHTFKIEPTPLKLAMINKIASPSTIRREKGDKEEGALVHEPEKGNILKNVLMLDFGRFYISIILALLVSPENEPGKNNKKLIKILPDGTVLDKPMYFLPALALYLIQSRERAEDGLKNAMTDYLKAFFQNQRNSYKDLTSGLWGYIATTSGRYYAEHVANMILSESRSKNIALKDYLETTIFKDCVKKPIYGDSSGNEIVEYKYGDITFKVSYGDTDSSFPRILNEGVNIKHVDFDKINFLANKFLTDLCNEQGYPVPITVKIEKVYSKLNLVEKKFYYGQVIWKDGKWLTDVSYDIKGMQTIRSDHSQFSKNFQYAVIVNHLNHGLDGLKRVVKRYSKNLEKGLKHKEQNFLVSISKPISFKEDFDYYRYKTDDDGNFILDEFGEKIPKKVTAYVRYCDSAEIWNEFVTDIEDKIQKGSKGFSLPIKYSSIPKLNIKHYAIYTDINLIDWNKMGLDIKRIQKNNITDKVANILNSLGMNKNQINNLIAGKSFKDNSKYI
jgi:hypothetical protein